MYHASRLALALVIGFMPLPAPATALADELARCMVRSTTPADRTQLVRWLYTALSLHPAVQSMAAVTTAQIRTANRDAGRLVMRVLTESCREEASAALAREGRDTLRASFLVLGNVAGREMFDNRDVAAAMAGVGLHVDLAELEALLGNE